MTRASTMSMKKPHTSGTTITALYAAPYCWVTAILLAIAVAVEPNLMPTNAAEITAASCLRPISAFWRSMNTLASTRKGQQRCSALDQSAEVGLEADTREKQLQKEVAYLKLEL